jgi:hypothetical protein
MKSNLETFKALAKVLGYTVVKKAKRKSKTKKKTGRTQHITTSKGFIWSKVRNGWKDNATGIIWYPALKGLYTWEQAKEQAQVLNLDLPTKEDFQTAELHGFREVLKDMVSNYFWSSSPYPTNSDLAYYFYGDYGGTDYYYRTLTLSVRLCEK